MKLAITGKGGVGKTTVSVLLAKYLAEEGRPVVLIDADPDANTATALGIAEDGQPEPISELKDLIFERTGAKGTGGEFYTLNPRVDDIPERYAVQVDGIRLLRMGRMVRGGGGCFCPENAFLKSLLSHLLFKDDEAVILDMEAGIEHLGRATAEGVDAMVAVVEPSRLSIQTAHSIKRYAADIGLSEIGILVNRYRSEDELQSVVANLSGFPLVGQFPYDEGIARAALAGTCPYVGSDQQRRRIAEALGKIEEFIERRKSAASPSS